MTALELVSNDYDRLNREYDNLLSLVARIKSGEVAIVNVDIDTAKRGWVIRPQNADLGALAGHCQQRMNGRLTPAARAVMEAMESHEDNCEEGV